MSRPSRILNFLSPLMHSSIEAALLSDATARQRLEEQRRTPSDQPRRKAASTR